MYLIRWWRLLGLCLGLQLGLCSITLTYEAYRGCHIRYQGRGTVLIEFGTKRDKELCTFLAMVSAAIVVAFFCICSISLVGIMKQQEALGQRAGRAGAK